MTYGTTDLEQRAVMASRKAAIKATGSAAGWNEPSDVQEVTYEGLQYVVLTNRNGVMAVYRVQPNGRLKGLKRWPAGVVEGVV